MGFLSILSTLLFLSLALGAPQQQSDAAKTKTPAKTPPSTSKQAGGGTAGLAQNLVYSTSLVQEFVKKIKSDPKHFTQTWHGPNPCNYKGFECKPTDQGFEAIETINIQAFFLGPNLDLTGFLDKLPYCTSFFAAGNDIVKIPDDLSHSPFLYYLDLGSTHLSGPFPKSLLTAKNLLSFSLRYNDLEGPIPPELFKMDLETITLSYNKFSGPLPEEAGSSRVQFLYLDANEFSGTIPSGIGNIVELEEFAIYKNKFTGPLPTQWRGGNLIFLDAGENQLSGSIPGEIFNSVWLENFYVDKNKLTGPLPTNFGPSKKLLNFDVSNNQLTGPVPESLCKFEKLEGIYLTNNNFDGELGPACLALLNKKVLHADGNCLKNAPRQKPGCGIQGNGHSEAPPAGTGKGDKTSGKTTKTRGKTSTTPGTKHPRYRRNRLA